MIVGIGYNFGVGKDAAAAALCRDLGYIRYAFADSLKRVAMDIDPLVTPTARTVNLSTGHGRLAHTVQGLGWDGAKSTYPEVRRVLQNLGSACRKEFGDDFWVKNLLAGIKPDERVVIPDVRYINEAEAIQGAGGTLINITRPGFTGDGHPSERDLDVFDDWDFVYHNTGSVPELELAVVTFVRDALKGGRGDDD